MEVNESLKRFRKNLGLTQAEIADLLGIHRQAYQPYETGKTTPSVKMIMKIADAFDVSTDYLLGRTDTPKPVEVGAEEVAKAREFKEALKKFVDETGV